MIYISAALEKDIPIIQQIAEKSWNVCYKPILSPQQINYMLQKLYNSDELTAQMRSGHSFRLLCENEFLVGFAVFSEIGKSTWKLHKIYFLPEMQGRGFGRQMLDHIVEFISTKNAEILLLNVNKKNPAQHFYFKYGFRIIDDVVIDIGEGFVMDDYVMSLNISEKNSHRNTK